MHFLYPDQRSNAFLYYASWLNRHHIYIRCNAEERWTFCVFCTMLCDIIIQHKPKKCTIFVNQYLISDFCYVFLTFLVHPQGDSCVYNMVCFTCIDVSSVCLLAHSPTYQTAHTDACTIYHTANTTVSLKMNPLGFETCRRNQKLNINL